MCMGILTFWWKCLFDVVIKVRVLSILAMHSRAAAAMATTGPQIGWSVYNIRWCWTVGSNIYTGYVVHISKFEPNNEHRGRGRSKTVTMHLNSLCPRKLLLKLHPVAHNDLISVRWYVRTAILNVGRRIAV